MSGPDYAVLSDDELMGALGSGDGESLCEIVRRYEAPVTRFLFRLLGDFERARDLAQETFLRVFRAAAGYRTSAEFTTWLYRIARNLARDEVRLRKRRPVLSLLGVDAEGQPSGADEGRFLAGANDPKDEAGRLEVRAMVMTAIEALPRRDRLVLLLRDIKGCSYEKIAEVLDIPLGTVKSRVNRARHRFKEIFERSHGTEVLTP